MWLSRDCAIGNAAKMGPGYFPFVLGGFLAELGAVILLRSVLWTAGSQARPVLHFKPLAPQGRKLF
jgi:hypothetical protein